MRQKLRRVGLFVLTLVPIASVAFAARAALSVAQIGKPGITTFELAGNGNDSMK